MKNYILIALLLVFTFFFSCKDEIEQPGIKMEFVETQCANPWDALPANDNYLLTIHQYLNDNGIKVYSIAIELTDEGNGIHCDACNCPSGRIIVIRTLDADIEAAEQLGFSLVH